MFNVMYKLGGNRVLVVTMEVVSVVLMGVAVTFTVIHEVQQWIVYEG